MAPTELEDVVGAAMLTTVGWRFEISSSSKDVKVTGYDEDCVLVVMEKDCESEPRVVAVQMAVPE